MFYKNNIGILLATLIVALFIPNLSVVHADEEEELTIPPYLGPYDPYDPYMQEWEVVEVLDVAAMGEYDTKRNGTTP